jgi:multicomponent Na+:H+ antiporter subunit A
MILLAVIAFPFVFAPLVGGLGRQSSPLVAAIPVQLFIAFCALLPTVAAGGHVLEAHPWIPSLEIEASFRVDGLSLLFALLISGIGGVVFLYASSYLRGHVRLTRFYVVLTLFMGSMLGAVLADDLVLLVVFWELTSLTSFLLIGYEPERAEARRAAQQGLLVTVAGGLSLLAGVILLGTAAGTYSITQILGRADALATHPLVPAIILLFAFGAFAKSAQAPLHSWLANAMVAPTPVSAYLHSATMVKLGVYLLARFNPVFGAHDLWIALLTTVGAGTMITAAVLALRETDLKRVLAYSTVVSLGTLIMLIGIPGELAAVAAVTFLLVHALYKACLFLVAGAIDHATRTRDSSALGGLRQAMPITAVAALLGSLSMAGLPPFVGFAAKELVYETSLTEAPAWWLLVGAALLANAAMVVVAAIVTVRCFLGVPRPTPKVPHDPDLTMLAGPLLLGLLGLVFGIAPWLASGSLVVPAASAIAGHPVAYALSLWHGFTPMLALSALTLVLGVLAFWRWDGLRAALTGIAQIDRWGPDRGYDRLMAGLQRLALWQTGLIQSGSLRSYVGRVLLVVAVAGGATLWLRDGFALPFFAGLAPDLALVALLVVATLAVTGARNFVSGIIAAGMVGFVVALIYLFRGAPDLAFTQFSVEALAIVIFLAIVGRLPFREQDYRTRPERRRDAGIAAAVGLMAALVFLSVLSLPFDARLSDYFRQTSIPEAHGHNLVNVIIVDFRALDTLGEISVLGLAAIAAAAVLAGLRRRAMRALS